MRRNDAEGTIMRMIVAEARARSQAGGMPGYSPRAVFRRTIAAESACDPPREKAGWKQETDPLDSALERLESDLSYLEELPGALTAPVGAGLDEMDRRLKQLIASLDRPRS